MKTLVASTPLPFFHLSHFLYHHLVLVSDFLSILCAHKNMCGFFQKKKKKSILGGWFSHKSSFILFLSLLCVYMTEA